MTLLTYFHHKSAIHLRHQSVRTLSQVTSKKHHERRLLQFTTDQCYNVVSDISKYRNFVPWVQDSIILNQDKNHMEAELVVGYQIFSERYISNVTLNEPVSVIAVSNQTNLFEHLRTEWKFSPSQDSKCCWVTFQVDFQF